MSVATCILFSVVRHPAPHPTTHRAHSNNHTDAGVAWDAGHGADHDVRARACCSGGSWRGLAQRHRASHPAHGVYLLRVLGQVTPPRTHPTPHSPCGVPAGFRRADVRRAVLYVASPTAPAPTDVGRPIATCFAHTHMRKGDHNNNSKRHSYLLHLPALAQLRPSTIDKRYGRGETSPHAAALR